MKNPFKYGSRVGGNAFFDRAKIMRDMLCVVDGGNNAVLYGPRRYGKTSLMGEIIDALRAKGWVCLEVNMMDMASLDDFIAQYAKAIYREVSPVLGTIRHVANLFSRVSPKVGIDDEGRPELKFEVQGHTDNTGNATSNQTLSEARAKAIVTKLTEMGIAADRLTAVGKGQTSPIADNSTDEGRAKNRRVEFVKK